MNVTILAAVTRPTEFTVIRISRKMRNPKDQSETTSEFFTKLLTDADKLPDGVGISFTIRK